MRYFVCAFIFLTSFGCSCGPSTPHINKFYSGQRVVFKADPTKGAVVLGRRNWPLQDNGELCVQYIDKRGYPYTVWVDDIMLEAAP
jgi:hypothetical protein